MPRAESPAPVCDLGALGGARSRHRRLLGTLLGAAVVVAETPRGWRLELPSEGRLFRVAAAWVSLERRCCPFIGCRLAWSRRGRVRLAVEAGDAAGREALLAGLRAVLAAGEPARRSRPARLRGG
jgi:hypothetical protein